MGLSQSDLAEAIQTSPAQIDAYEYGVVRIEAVNLIRLSEALGVRLSYFFQGCLNTLTRKRSASHRTL